MPRCMRWPCSLQLQRWTARRFRRNDCAKRRAAGWPPQKLTILPSAAPERPWLHDHPDDETRAIVEDADALLPSIHEGLAQHSASDLLKYSGTVSAIRVLDADHAEVDYILLFDGRPQFGVRTGIAVRINGHWMVSRATECSLLSLGGIICPPE